MKNITILEKVNFTFGLNKFENPEGLSDYKQKILEANGITYQIDNPESVICSSITIHNVNVLDLRFYVDLINNTK